jgi:hypothetical protein
VSEAVQLLKGVLTEDVCNCVSFILNSHEVLSMDWLSQTSCMVQKHVWKQNVYDMRDIIKQKSLASGTKFPYWLLKQYGETTTQNGLNHDKVKYTLWNKIKENNFLTVRDH